MLTMMTGLMAKTTAPAPVERVDPDSATSLMTNAEIKAFNGGLTSTHPHFIKCRRIGEIGSLVKKARVCHTNTRWKQPRAVGNQDSRNTLEGMTRAPVNQNN